MSVERFMMLFSGLDRAYGTYKTDSSDVRHDGKVGGKATTIRGAVVPELWQKHLMGESSLGIVPLNDDGNCKFGAIDIDVYNLDVDTVLKKLEPLKSRLCPCRSKSGGLHLYMFTEEWVPAGVLQRKLKEIAASIGYGQSEIFPKQTKLLATRGDVGGWINMPYFDVKNADRVMVGLNGQTFSSEEFLSYAEKHRVPRSHFAERVDNPEADFLDGPPCLEILSQIKFREGSRNKGLFNVGVYLRKRYPDDWKSKLESANIKYVAPPLKSDEVQQIIKSLNRKKYEYTCSQEPICNHCNLGVCKNKKYGVGESASMPLLHSLTKFDTHPPIWFVDVESGGRLELTTDDLQNQRKFQKRCLDSLNMLPNRMGDTAWTQLVNNLLESLIVIEMPKESSSDGLLMAHVEMFCQQRAQAKTKEEILMGKPWFNKIEDNTGDDRHYFRMTDLMAYLDRQRFKEFKVHEVTVIIKKFGATHAFFNLKGRGTNCWSLKLFADGKHTNGTESETT